MANKYELRRRALKDARGRSDNPFASPRDIGAARPIEYAPPPPMDRPWITTGICFGLVLLVTLLYVQTARHSFIVCDDNVYIYGPERPEIKAGLTWKGVKWAWGASHAGNWHPLTWVSHMLDWQLFGTWQPENGVYVDSWPGGHHLMNMAMHCANAVLLFLALRLMTGALWPCVVVSALFAAHPLRAESVAWAAERKDVLCGLFWMASMLAYAFYARRRPLLQSSSPEAAATIGMYLLVTLLFAMALLAKSMAVTLPAVFLLLDAWPLGRWRKALSLRGHHAEASPNFISSAWRFFGKLRALRWFALLVRKILDAEPRSWLFVEKLPWFAMVAYDCHLTLAGQEKGVALNSWDALPWAPRVLNALMSVANYLGQMFWPAGMAPFYVHPYMLKSSWSGWTTVNYCEAAIGATILVVVTAAVIGFRHKAFLAVGWFWFLGTLMPVIGIEQVGTQSRADRYTYLPMIGVYLMIAWLLKEAADRWPRTRIALAAAAVLVFTTLSVLSFKQVSYWIDSYALFGHALQVTDNNWFAYNHIGIAYDADAKKLASGEAKDPEKLFDRVAETFQGPPKHLDDSLQQPLALAGAAVDFKSAARKLNFPQKAQLLFDYSADAFQSTIDIKPDYDFGNNNLGVYYAHKNRPEDMALAEKYFRLALTSNQRYADAFNNLGIILAREGDEFARVGKFDESERKFNESIALHIEGLKVLEDRASDRNNLCRVYIQRRDLYLKEGQPVKAQADLNSAIAENTAALDLDHNNLASLISKCEIANIQKQPDEAAACVRRMIVIDAKSPETIRMVLMFGENCVNLGPGHAGEAIEMLSQFIKGNDTVPNAYYLRGLAYGQKGDLDHAQEDFARVVLLAPRFPGAQERLEEIRQHLASPRK